MKERERTFIMIKPDAVQRGLVGDIIKRCPPRCSASDNACRSLHTHLLVDIRF